MTPVTNNVTLDPVTKKATIAAGAKPEGTCQECGNRFPVRADGPGRIQRYCSRACRTRAYRARHAPGLAEMRRIVGEQIEAASGVDWRRLAGVVDNLELTELGEVRRHLGAALGAWEAVSFWAAPAPAPTAALSATDDSVTETPTMAPTADRPRVARPAPALGMVGGLKPTQEQASIISVCVAGGNLVIEAGAGTGKTSTLRMAATLMRGRGLYVAFNRAIAGDARKSFPKSVTCATAHSLAFRAVGHAYKPRLDGPRLPAQQSAALLGITSGFVVEKKTIDPVQLARLALDAVGRWCRTADDALALEHVPPVNGVEGAAAAELAAAVLPYAVAAWDDLKRPDGKLRFVHDHYLKMWALTRPQLDADYILFDEAQDADPLIASVVQAQRCQLIAVGDECQAIYGWRGAVDALATWPATDRLYLSQSWRFGPAVAEEANKWLQLLSARLRLSGAPTMRSAVGPVQRPRAVLCRTNAEAIRQAIIAMDAGRRTGLVGGGTAIKRMAKAALDLQQGRPTDHPELFMFTNWGEVQEYVKTDTAGGDLAVFVRMVDDMGAEDIIAAAGRLCDERYADVAVSTAHKAKGREWDSVLIGDDFRQPKADEQGRPGRVPRGEAMLAYVAVTRARKRLDRTGLAWIDDQLAGVAPAPRRHQRDDWDDWRTTSQQDW